MTFGGHGPGERAVTCEFWGGLGWELRRDFLGFGPEGRGVTCDFWGAWAGRKCRDL